MRLVTFDDDRAGVVRGDEVVDVTALVRSASGTTAGSTMKSLVTHYSSLRDAVVAAARDAPGHPLQSVVLQAPLPDPSKIVAAPVNYEDHMSEMNVHSNVSALGFFLKSPASLIGPDAEIRLPYVDRRFDQEGEFALIVGKRARKISTRDALDHVFGYTGLLDITMRGGEDRSTRKSFDTFTPTGPWIVTADELVRPDDVQLSCSVSGQCRQHASTAALIWDIPRFLAYVSSVTTLEPGDIVTTGTPSGVGPLEHGDTIELELSGIGRLRARVTSDGATACPTAGAGRGDRPPPVRGKAGDASEATATTAGLPGCRGASWRGVKDV